MTDLETASPIGRRIQILGNTGSGKSTLAARLAQVLDAAFVELDALNWEPGWVGVHDRDPQELERRFHAATRGERWVVAGSYMSHSQRCFWGAPPDHRLARPPDAAAALAGATPHLATLAFQGAVMGDEP